MASRNRSRKIYEKYGKLTPGGVHSNIRFFDPFPIYLSRAKGARVWDVDGNEYTA